MRESNGVVRATDGIVWVSYGIVRVSDGMVIELEHLGRESDYFVNVQWRCKEPMAL